MSATPPHPNNICVETVLTQAVEQLESADVHFGHGTDNAWDEACVLLGAVMQWPVDVTDAVLSDPLTLDQQREFDHLISRRIELRIPAAYLIKRCWFAGLEFAIDERALVPRSPLAELIRNQYAPWIDTPPSSILDLCTGSGCIGIAAAVYASTATVVLTDLSRDALELAQENVNKHQLMDRVQIVQGDLFAGVAALSPTPKFDVILSNPPYVDARDFYEMPDEYRREPELGLVSGDDGLDITRRILREAADYLTDAGVLIVEVGNSWPALETAYPNVAFTWLEFAHGGDGVFLLTRPQLLALASGG